jgi:hypothetical protein
MARRSRARRWTARTCEASPGGASLSGSPGPASIAEARELENASDVRKMQFRAQQLIDYAEQARRTAGFANANLTRALTAAPPASPEFNYVSRTQLR